MVTLPVKLLTFCRPSHMKQLFKLCKARTIVWKELPYGDHNSTVAEPGYFNYMDQFIQAYVAAAT